MDCKHMEHRGGGRLGSIEVICGSMFSGKTEELMRRMRRAKIARQRTCIFKPTIDTRYDESDVVSHDRNAIASVAVANSEALACAVGDAEVIGIDEAQFFDLGLVDVAQELADGGCRVIVAGLDLDFRRQPFGPMANLCAIADSVDKIHAICIECGRLANFSYRFRQGEEQVMLGETGTYSPLCRTCYLSKEHH